jgi:membrane associated rhomboid family serine protease
VSSSVPSTGSTPVRTGAATLGRSVAVMAGLLALLWVLEFFDSLIGHRLDYYGIHAQDVDGLPGILTAPLLHGGWGHLIGNSVPFFVLGLLVLLSGLARWIWSTVISIITSGLTAWLLTPAGTVIIGASGLIFGWLTYLLARGLWSRKIGQVVIAAAVLLFYGGMIVGILPGAAGVSWQAHLGGAIGGILAAWLLHRKR